MEISCIYLDLTRAATKNATIGHLTIFLVKGRVLARADFHLFKRRGRNISGGVQVAPLSDLRQGLGIWVKAFPPNRRGEAKFWWG